MIETLHALSQFHFLRPWWLLLLMPLAILWIAMLRQRKSGSSWSDECDAHLLPLLLIHQPSKTSKLPIYLLACGWLLATLALAGPTWLVDKIPLYRRNDAVVVLLDMSYNMLAQDLTPNRFLRARFKLIDFLQKRKEGQTGLIAYTGEPYLVTPLTEDTNNIIALLPELTPDIMPASGNDIARALQKATQVLHHDNHSPGAIFLISASDEVSSSAIEAAAQLHKNGDVLHVLSIGNPQATPISAENGGYLQNQHGDIVVTRLNRDQLKNLANTGGGIYVDFQNDSRDINAILNALPQLTNTKASAQSLEIWQDSGYWLVIFLLPLAALVFRRGWHDRIEG